MMTKKIIIALVALLMANAEISAQGFLKGLGQKALDKAKEKVENKVERTVDSAADRVLDRKRTEINNREVETDEPDVTTGASQQQQQPKPRKKAQGEDVKSDFVPGSVVIFEDDLKGEQMGEFPSKWDLLENNAEVARMNGRMAIKFEHGSDTEITPLLEDGNKKYLPEVYTLEFDFFVTGEEDHTSAYRLWLKPEEGNLSEIFFGRDDIRWFVQHPTSENLVQGNTSLENIVEQEDWNHFALSFNKRALKVYINGRRVINIPNAKAMDWFSLRTEFWEDHIDYITNVRLAKGAVALYDRNAQSMTAVEKAMQETGKFVTNNILFETGKADLKPESMEEIGKVAEYMKKNPSVRFEVQGHTDNQGSDAINDPLSQKRAEAIVKALVTKGVDEWNLRAVGKGSHEPVADNKTDGGRAKNRRVEFIKK